MWANNPFRGLIKTHGEAKNWLNNAQVAFGEAKAMRRAKNSTVARMT